MVHFACYMPTRNERLNGRNMFNTLLNGLNMFSPYAAATTKKLLVDERGGLALIG